MDRTCRKDHRHLDFIRILAAIRQNQMPSARADGLFSLGSDTVDRIAQPVRRAPIKRAINRRDRIAKRLDHRLKFRIRHEWAVEHEDLGLLVAFIQNIAQIAKPRLQTHHAKFAQTVDGRIGDLAEILTEEMAQRAVHVRQNSRRRIVPHRRDAFFRIFRHRVQNHL